MRRIQPRQRGFRADKPEKATVQEVTDTPVVVPESTPKAKKEGVVARVRKALKI